MNFCIIDESHFTANELLTAKEAVEEFGNKDLTKWEFGTVTCSIGNPQKGDIRTYITTRNRKRGASAYHDKDAGGPFIYCLPGDAFNRDGFFAPAKAAHWIGKFLSPARKQIIQPGMLTSLLHEVGEVLSDPLLQSDSAPDGLGHNYLREIADPVFGINYVKVINKINCVFPAVVLPNWYLLGSIGPWDTAGFCTAPFQKSPRGYAYWVKLVKKVRTFIKV